MDEYRCMVEGDDCKYIVIARSKEEAARICVERQSPRVGYDTEEVIAYVSESPTSLSEIKVRLAEVW